MQTARAQGKESVNTAVANNAMGMVNQRGPDGSLTYNQVGGYTDPNGNFIPRYEAVTELSQAGQERLNTTNAAQQNMANIAQTLSGRIDEQAGNPVSMENLPGLPGSGGYEASRKSVEDALYARLNPQLDRARESMATRLANSGIRVGSAAYDRAMQNQGMTENDARQQVVLAGGQEQSRMAGLDSSARAQQLQERYQSANDPVNRLTALLSGSQVNTPQYQTYTPQGMATTDMAGLIADNYGQQMNQYGIKQQNYQDTIGGLFGLGKAAIMASDERFKKDIEPMGEANGHKVYAYRYQNEDDKAPKHVGVMAQEVEKTRPDAVINTPIGKAVDYGKLGLVGLGTLMTRGD
jgi:hypothetical protein